MQAGAGSYSHTWLTLDLHLMGHYTHHKLHIEGAAAADTKPLTWKLSKMSGSVASRWLRYREALRTAAVLLCRMSDTRKSRATLVGTGVSDSVSASVRISTTCKSAARLGSRHTTSVHSWQSCSAAACTSKLQHTHKPCRVTEAWQSLTAEHTGPTKQCGNKVGAGAESTSRTAQPAHPSAMQMHRELCKDLVPGQTHG